MRAIFVAVIAIVVGIIGCAAPVKAQEWPTRPITIIVPFAVGGSADLLSRIVAAQLRARLGQSVVVENRPGAGGTIGTNFLVRSKPDGYTLLISSVVNPEIYTHLPFDVDKDIKPITQLVNFPNLLVVNPKLPVMTIQELINYVKTHDGEINYASSGVGTTSHLSTVMFEMAIGAKMTHVPFKGAGEVVNSLLAGTVDMATDSMTVLWPQAAQGAVRAVGVTSPQRSETAPDVPAIAETIPGFDGTAWQGLFGPAGMPEPLVDKIAAEIKQIWALPELKNQLSKIGGVPVVSENPEAFLTFTRMQRAKWGNVAKTAGVKIE